MKHLVIVFLAMIVFASSAMLLAISEVTDDWAGSCLEECRSRASEPAKCNIGSIRFIADQFARAVNGEPYWETAGGKHFADHKECGEYRMNQLRSVCPAASEVLKKSLH